MIRKANLDETVLGSGTMRSHRIKQLAVAVVAVAATATLGMTAPATAHTPVTTKGLAPMTSCMTPHQAWVWEKAILSVPAIVLVPPHICK
jgi:hypothetical protein